LGAFVYIINLSDLYYKAGDLASAVGTLQRGSYELQDNLTIAHLLARVYIDDQRWEYAIEELERVRAEKYENRGGFEKKILLIETVEKE
jgi:predicted Zn-dependent protease